MTEAERRGLDGAEAARRLAAFGPNAIREERPHPLRALLSRFSGPIPLLLELVILIQLALGEKGEALIIAILLVVNAGIGFIEEGRADQALRLLKRRLEVTARAKRDGAWQSVPAESLVPGDLVHLRMGDLSPADVRLVAGELMIDQSALTGESLPVEARPGLLAYAGAVIQRGEATGEVEATGAGTYFGKAAELVRRAKTRSRLEALVFRIVRVLVIVDLGLVAMLLVDAAAVGLPYREVLPFALILLIASVPIALPVTFTLATALGAAELARRGVLVTHLGAIEEAAGMDVLLTDKTGTITENRLALAALVPLSGESETALLRFAALACDAATQDPIDRAILAAAAAKGVAAAAPRRLDFRPFDPALRYSEGIYEAGAGKLRVLKGAPSALAALVAEPPDLGQRIAALAGEGNRVLAIAAGDEDRLRLAGLLALADPPRADSPALVEGLAELGVRVVMVTGDNLETARAVARAVGIGARAAGPDALDHIEQARDYDVFARAFPEHKFRLAEFYQQHGHIVGMTGDGVNDAPALKQADVGIAVAGATDVARAAAGIVLTRPGLVDALAAVELSRRIYQRMLTYTINKIVKTLEIAVFLTVGVMLAHAFVITPLLIVLLLFTNDFVTMALATDTVSFSRRPDRWNVRDLMLTGGMLAALILALSFAVFFVGRDLFGLPLPALQTLVFVMLVLTGQGTVYLVRERGHFWRSRPSRPLLFSSLADIAVVLAMASEGILMTAVSPGLLLALVAAVAFYLLLVDQIKVKAFRGLRIR
ncbi:MAG TPA: plasma-membrane proton-efflux P-type ATPase [Stellaceae bacterium]|nr:plasma-membrane proton-efflux P-type ATPase [Stellaceae bacterium]